MDDEDRNDRFGADSSTVPVRAPVRPSLVEKAPVVAFLKMTFISSFTLLPVDSPPTVDIFHEDTESFVVEYFDAETDGGWGGPPSGIEAASRAAVGEGAYDSLTDGWYDCWF